MSSLNTPPSDPGSLCSVRAAAHPDPLCLSAPSLYGITWGGGGLWGASLTNPGLVRFAFPQWTPSFMVPGKCPRPFSCPGDLRVLFLPQARNHRPSMSLAIPRKLQPAHASDPACCSFPVPSSPAMVPLHYVQRAMTPPPLPVVRCLAGGRDTPASFCFHATSQQPPGSPASPPPLAFLQPAGTSPVPTLPC